MTTKGSDVFFTGPEQGTEFLRKEFSFIIQAYKVKGQSLHPGKMYMGLVGNQKATKVIGLDGQGLTWNVNNQKLGRWIPQLYNLLAV